MRARQASAALAVATVLVAGVLALAGCASAPGLRQGAAQAAAPEAHAAAAPVSPTGAPRATAAASQSEKAAVESELNAIDGELSRMSMPDDSDFNGVSP